MNTMIANTLCMHREYTLLMLMDYWIKTKSWDDRYWFIECTERPQREIYEKSRYDIYIKYYDCKYNIISILKHISEQNY